MKDPAAVKLGRKGGFAKWRKVPKGKRSEIMRAVRAKRAVA